MLAGCAVRPCGWYPLGLYGDGRGHDDLWPRYFGAGWLTLLGSCWSSCWEALADAVSRK